MSRTAHDALFKAAFRAPAHTAALLAPVLPAELRSAITWPALAPQTASITDGQLRQQHNDLLFQAPFAELGGHVLVLLEHQSQVDPTMAQRVLTYLTRIWSTCTAPPLPPILALVLSHDEQGWTAPLGFRELVVPGVDQIPDLAAFLPAFSIQVLDLIALSNDDLMGWPLPPFPKLALWLLRDARTPERLLLHLPLWAPLFAAVHAAPSGAHALTQLFRYITLVASEDIFEDLRNEILAHLPTTEDTLMTIAESLRREGRQEGLAEGRQEGLAEGRQEGLAEGRQEGLAEGRQEGLAEGRQEGLAEGRQQALLALVTKQLAFKFGQLDAHAHALLGAASMSELERIGEELMRADTLSALLASTLRPEG